MLQRQAAILNKKLNFPYRDTENKCVSTRQQFQHYIPLDVGSYFSNNNDRNGTVLKRNVKLKIPCSVNKIQRSKAQI